MFELISARETERPKGGLWKDAHYVKPYNGWEFERKPVAKESASTTALREQLLGNILCKSDGQPMTRPQDRRYLQGF
jgi:hypothetical protein